MLEALLLLLPYSASSACCSLPRKSEGLHCIAFFLTSVQSYQVPRSFPSSPSTSFLTSSHLISFQLIALLSYFLSLWLLSSPEPTFLSSVLKRLRFYSAFVLSCPVLDSTRLDFSRPPFRAGLFHSLKCPSLSHHPVIPCGQFFVFFFPYVTLLFFSTFLSNCSLWAKPTTTNSQPSFTRILPGDPPSAASSATLDQATSVTLHDIVRLVSHFYLKISTTTSHTQLFIRPVVNFGLGSPRVTNDLSK